MSERRLALIARLGSFLKVIHQLSAPGDSVHLCDLAQRLADRISHVAREARENGMEIEQQLQAAERDIILGAADIARFVKRRR